MVEGLFVQVYSLRVFKIFLLFRTILLYNINLLKGMFTFSFFGDFHTLYLPSLTMVFIDICLSKQKIRFDCFKRRVEGNLWL